MSKGYFKIGNCIGNCIHQPSKNIISCIKLSKHWDYWVHFCSPPNLLLSSAIVSLRSFELSRVPPCSDAFPLIPSCSVFHVTRSRSVFRSPCFALRVAYSILHVSAPKLRSLCSMFSLRVPCCCSVFHVPWWQLYLSKISYFKCNYSSPAISDISESLELCLSWN